MLGGLDALEAGRRLGCTSRPTADDEDVHTALERGLHRAARTAGRQAARRAQPQRPGRHRPAALPARPRTTRRRRGRWPAASAARPGRGARRRAAPGFTHLQHAQPVSFGHELAKHVHALARDVDRLRDWDARARVLAAGCRRAGRLVAAAGPGGRRPRELGFAGAIPNSIDAVSDRDFAAEFLFCTALLAVHLSRLGEEVCLWTSREFGWAVLDDAFSTGSSIMPQKKNPDIAELARGKAGRLIGTPDRAARHPQGPAVRLQPRPAGGQGGRLRLGRHPAPRCSPR